MESMKDGIPITKKIIPIIIDAFPVYFTFILYAVLRCLGRLGGSGCLELPGILGNCPPQFIQWLTWSRLFDVLHQPHCKIQGSKTATGPPQLTHRVVLLLFSVRHHSHFVIPRFTVSS